MTEYKCPKWEEVYTKELTLQALFEKLIDIENRMKDEVFILTERIDKLEGETKMIEMRIVEIGDGCRPDFQYRYKLPENETYYDKNMKIVEWSYWETAPYVKAEEIEND